MYRPSLIWVQDLFNTSIRICLARTVLFADLLQPFLVMDVCDRLGFQLTYECFCIPFMCTCYMRHKDIFCESVSGDFCQKSMHKSMTWNLPRNDRNSPTTFFPRSL